MIKRKLTAAVAAAVIGSSVALTGCMGHSGATKLVGKMNLMIVDNKFGRAGMFILMAPLYAFAQLGDLVVFNSVEFWTGKNPITGQTPPLTQVSMDTWLEINPSLDDQFTSLESKVINNVAVTSATEDRMVMELTFEDGQTFDVTAVKNGEQIDLYADDKLLGSTSQQKLADAVAMR